MRKKYFKTHLLCFSKHCSHQSRDTRRLVDAILPFSIASTLNDRGRHSVTLGVFRLSEDLNLVLLGPLSHAAWFSGQMPGQTWISETLSVTTSSSCGKTQLRTMPISMSRWELRGVDRGVCVWGGAFHGLSCSEWDGEKPHHTAILRRCMRLWGHIMGFSGSGLVWGWGLLASLGLGSWPSLPKPHWFLCPPSLPDLPLPAIQCHSFTAGSPGVRGCGAPSHGQPSLGPV